MATHNTSGAPLTMAVYVVGISGNCSKDYIGCGKSCLCRQFVYKEYMEELYSTLLQAEFDSSVIGQQHVIYWGQKEETYSSTAESKSAMVNYEVFEHTLLYQDATGLPFSGRPYNQQIFLPLSKFLNKLSFKSRDLILTPELSLEEYEAKAFSYIYKVPIAYLYVVDVSQSCPVFMKQLELMNNLIKMVKKKKHHCVIVANKYDMHSAKNMEKLEMWASALDIDVIQCSAKYDINIDHAFRYLAMKAFTRQLSRFATSVQPYAEIAVEKRKAVCTNSDDNNVYINTIPHLNLTDELSNLSLSDQRVHNDLTSLAVVQEIKNTNSNSNNLSFELSSEACAAFDDDTYEFPSDVMEEKPKILKEYKSDIDNSFKDDMEEKPKILKDHESDIDNSLNGDTGDRPAQPEVDFPFHLKRSTSFRKAAYNSFKHKFSKNKVSSKCPDSVEEFVVIANGHFDEDVHDHVNGCVSEHVSERVNGCASGRVNGHINGHINGQITSSTFDSVQNTCDHEHSRLPNGVSKKKVHSNPK